MIQRGATRANHSSLKFRRNNVFAGSKHVRVDKFYSPPSNSRQKGSFFAIPFALMHSHEKKAHFFPTLTALALASCHANVAGVQADQGANTEAGESFPFPFDNPPGEPTRIGDFFEQFSGYLAPRNAMVGTGSSRRPTTEVQELMMPPVNGSAPTSPSLSLAAADFPTDMVFRSYRCETSKTCVDVLFFRRDSFARNDQKMTDNLQRMARVDYLVDLQNGFDPGTVFTFYRPKQGIPYTQLTSWLNVTKNVTENICAFLPNAQDSEGAHSVRSRIDTPDEEHFFSAQSAQTINTILVCVPDTPLPAPSSTPTVAGRPNEAEIYREIIDKQNQKPLRRSLAAMEFKNTNECSATQQLSFVNVGKHNLRLDFYNANAEQPNSQFVADEKLVVRNRTTSQSILTIPLPTNNRDRQALEIMFGDEAESFPAYLVHTTRVEFRRDKTKQERFDRLKGALLDLMNGDLPFPEYYTVQGNVYLHLYTPR